MKKISFSALFITAVIIISILLSSCSRKVGCYFSVSPEVESGRITMYSSTEPNLSVCIPDNNAIADTEVLSCD